MTANSTPEVILVTGGNSGVGFETGKIFLQGTKPYHTILTARSQKKADEAVALIKSECPGATNTIEPLALDVTSDDSIEEAFQVVSQKHGRVDALINNAGAAFDLDYTTGKISARECFNKAYDVNVTGAHCVTSTFMPLLLKSANPRLLFSAGLSMMTSVYDGPYFPTPPQPAGWPKTVDFETIGYRCSKTALSMLMIDYRHKLQEDGVKVWSVVPGFLATNLGGATEKIREMGGGHPSEGAVIYKKVVEGERDADAGRVISKDGLVNL